MKKTTHAPGRRTAPSALRHNERERQRRALHGGRIWTVTNIIDRPVVMLSSLAGFVPRGMAVERATSEDYGRRLALDLVAGPSTRTPAPKKGQTFTNWRHAAR